MSSGKLRHPAPTVNNNQPDLHRGSALWDRPNVPEVVVSACLFESPSKSFAPTPTGLFFAPAPPASHPTELAEIPRDAAENAVCTPTPATVPNCSEPPHSVLTKPTAPCGSLWVPLIVRGAAVIKLSRGRYARVTPDDFPLVCHARWYAVKSRQFLYAARDTVDGRQLMHRIITKAGEGVLVDHRNGNGLDNQRGNLRLASRFDNARNTRTPRSASGFRGVYWHKLMGKWRAEIRAGSTRIVIGHFDDPIEAAHSYDDKARELHGDFASPNFPSPPPARQRKAAP